MGINSAAVERQRADVPGGRFCAVALGPRLVMLFFGLVTVGGLWLTVLPPDLTARGVQLALAAAAVGGVMVSARLPVLAITVTVAVTACAWLLGLTADPFVLTGFAVFQLAERRGSQRFPWWMFAGAVVVAGALLIVGADGAHVRLRGMLLSALVVSLAWVLGVRTRQVRQGASARSRAQERLRLTRDVHDVLSHSLGTIGVQAGVAAHVSSLGPDELRAVLRDIERDARSSLSELTDFLHLERGGLAVDDTASSPLSAALVGVVHSAEKAGVEVRLGVDDGLDTLPLAVRTTVFRIVQEALTNVVRHAAAATAVVTVRVKSDALTVEVTDDGKRAPAEIKLGNGLRGMRERV